MFCSHCGKEIADNSTYCSYCGKSMVNIAQTQAMVYNQPQYYQRNIQRQCEISEVERMINYFYQKSAQYNEYDAVNERLFKLRRSSPKFLLSLACIFFTISFLALIYLAVLFLTWESKSLIIFEYDYTDVVPALVELLTFIPGIIFVVLYSKRLKRYNAETEYCLRRYYELADELYVHYVNYKNCPIGPEYTNPSNLQVIYQTIVSGRADSTKEALNVLVEDAHRKKMEQLAELTAQYAQAAAVNSARAASYARTGAIFAGANFFL